MEIVNSLWVEKYRPKTVEDIIMPEDYLEKFKGYISKNELSNLLLYGPPGGGKTTLARILTSKNGLIQNYEDNVLAINGSAKETRGINFTNEVVEPFLKIPPAGNDRYKIIFIDEADYLTDASFHSFRGIIEKYSSYGRFIFTCNYISKIPEAVQSRLTDYKLKQVSEEFVFNHVKDILKKEKIKYKEDDIKFLINNLYPDIRKIVDRTQKFSANGELKINKDITLSKEKLIISLFSEIIDAIKNKQNQKISGFINQILSTINDYDIDFREIYTKIFFKKEIPVPVKVVVNKYTNTHNNCLVDSMHFMSMIFESINTLQQFHK